MKFLFLFIEFLQKYDRTTKGGVYTLRQIPIVDQLKILFHGTTTLIGVGVFVVCLLFSLLTMDSKSLKAIYFIGKETPIMASVTAVIPQEGKNRVLYHYKVDEKTYPGDFYTTENTYKAGSYTEIEYANGSPKHSRLLGEKTNAKVIGAGIVLLISILLISIELKQNVSMWILINWGKLTRAVLVSKERGKKEESIVIFRYKDHDGTVHELTEKTLHPEQFNQQVPESILYLSKRPKMAVLVSKIPSEIPLYDI